ncbi:hypothetical protein X767_16190 [Mesorhizobium sp. LSJC264A00]|nr:hypothetical protein X767_16190 [Mesorhizobium sp. LSJC264A00]
MRLAWLSVIPERVDACTVATYQQPVVHLTNKLVLLQDWD